jgi:hypothetical protein
MELAGIWRTHFSLRYVPITMIQVISAAATIFVVAAVQAVSGPRIAHGALESAEKSAGLQSSTSAKSGTPSPPPQRRRHPAKPYTGASPNSKSASITWFITQWCEAILPRWLPGHPPTPCPRATLPGRIPLNPISTSSWTELIGTPFDGMYAHAQHSMGHPNAQYSTLAGALETPLSYHQPFGDGLGEFAIPSGWGRPPGYECRKLRQGRLRATDGDPLMMFRSPQQAFYAYQMGVPTSHPSARQ